MNNNFTMSIYGIDFNVIGMFKEIERSWGTLIVYFKIHAYYEYIPIGCSSQLHIDGTFVRNNVVLLAYMPNSVDDTATIGVVMAREEDDIDTVEYTVKMLAVAKDNARVPLLTYDASEYCCDIKYYINGEEVVFGTYETIN